MRLFLFLLFFSIAPQIFANKTAAEIYVDLQKVHSLKRVLYIAAHPDDENTRALAWFSLGEKAETAYLSLTRGDGGQNLIGNELSEDLGVLRTQELLAARSVDHANQYFSRAVDFGYSKSADESFEKWGKSEILADVVRVIRQFKPDVIITRFPPDERAGHGHHTASAMLAIEALEKAANPDFLPHQVQEFGAWQAAAVYWNSSSWWDNELAEKAKDNPDYIIKDIGGYNPLLGMSYNEIGTIARSQHKCQGFGAIVERGSKTEYFKHLAGKKLKNDFFENNTRSWSTLVSKDFEKAFDNLMRNFNFVAPHQNVPQLIALKKQLEQLPPSNLDEIKAEKITALNAIILNCSGLYIEAITADYAVTENENFDVEVNLINRSPLKVNLLSVNGSDLKHTLNQNEAFSQSINLKNTVAFSTPYWLRNPFDTRFTINDSTNLGKPENDPEFIVNAQLNISGEPIKLSIPVTYKWRDPSFGERRRPTISTPPFSANFDDKSVILKSGERKELQLKIHAFAENIDEVIQINVPNGWKVTPEKVELKSTVKHEEIWENITVEATSEAKRGSLTLTDAKGNTIHSLTTIEYDHIPTQTIFKPAALQTVVLNADIKPGKIAYLTGAGDEVPQAIRQLGFEVDVFETEDLATVNLSNYQTVVLGIRIYNVHPELHNFDEKLFNYVEEGGKLIMQYNTASRSTPHKKYGPIPFELSRKRVTEEDAKVTFLQADHPVLNTPNKIEMADFDHWVQERGLYFADNWDEKYTPIIGWHDQGEDSVNGALIIAPYGKGQFVYTGISFFRELPNGVEGAYRLFANLLSY